MLRDQQSSGELLDLLASNRLRQPQPDPPKQDPSQVLGQSLLVCVHLCNNSAGDVKSAITKGGGKPADSGSVMFNFMRQVSTCGNRFNYIACSQIIAAKHCDKCCCISKPGPRLIEDISNSCGDGRSIRESADSGCFWPPQSLRPHGVVCLVTNLTQCLSQ